MFVVVVSSKEASCTVHLCVEVVDVEFLRYLVERSCGLAYTDAVKFAE